MQSRCRLWPSAGAAAGKRQEAAGADVSFEVDARADESGGDVFDDVDIVVVTLVCPRSFLAPFDVTFQEGVHEDGDSFERCPFSDNSGNFERHPEVGGQAVRLYEVVELSRQWHIYKIA